MATLFSHRPMAITMTIEGAAHTIPVLVALVDARHISHEGPIMPPDSRAVTVDAIVDTGATQTAIPFEVARHMRLEPIRQQSARTAGGIVENVNVYLVNVVLYPGIVVMDVEVGEMASETTLIGMDILNLGDLAVTHDDGDTVVSYRFPSAGPVDFGGV